MDTKVALPVDLCKSPILCTEYWFMLKLWKWDKELFPSTESGTLWGRLGPGNEKKKFRTQSTDPKRQRQRGALHIEAEGCNWISHFHQTTLLLHKEKIPQHRCISFTLMRKAWKNLETSGAFLYFKTIPMKHGEGDGGLRSWLVEKPCLHTRQNWEEGKEEMSASVKLMPAWHHPLRVNTSNPSSALMCLSKNEV